MVAAIFSRTHRLSNSWPCFAYFSTRLFCFFKNKKSSKFDILVQTKSNLYPMGSFTTPFVAKRLTTCTHTELQLDFHFSKSSLPLSSYFHFSNICLECHHLAQFWTHGQHAKYYEWVFLWEENKCMISELVVLVVKLFDGLSKVHFGFFSLFVLRDTTICAITFPHAILNIFIFHFVDYGELIKRFLPLNSTK